MRSVVYDADQVVRLMAGVGATLVVSFSPEEKVTAVAGPNGKDFMVSPKDNFLFMKSESVSPSQPVIVLTEGAKAVRRYVFEMETVSDAASAAQKSNLYYSVQFVYPGDDADTIGGGPVAELQERKAEALLTSAPASNDEADAGPLTGTPNWHYIARGSRVLLPVEVLDNGYSTAFRFPGNTRIPSIFRLDPDGKEATANYSVKGDYVVVSSTAMGWRLRDGNAVLCIWNRAYDRVGASPGTGTTNPDVKRITEEPLK